MKASRLQLLRRIGLEKSASVFLYGTGPCGLFSANLSTDAHFCRNKSQDENDACPFRLTASRGDRIVAVRS